MTPGAMHCQALKGRYSGHDHVIPIVISRNEAIRFGDRQLNMSDIIPASCGDEPQSCYRSTLLRKQNIPRELFLNKSTVGFIVVERSNHIVPIRARVRT